MDTEENPLLIAALAYASKGWKVFPVYEPLPDGSCSCLKSECNHVGKHPRTSHGFKDATTDTVTIKNGGQVGPTPISELPPARSLESSWSMLMAITADLLRGMNSRAH